jgi:hypothetical protein
MFQRHLCQLQRLHQARVDVAKGQVDFIGGDVMQHSTIFPSDAGKDIFHRAQFGIAKPPPGHHEQGIASRV